MKSNQTYLLDLNNRTQEKIEAGETSLGLFLLSGNSMIAETLSTLPIDWLMIDMEASPVTKEGVLHIMQALNGSRVTPMIRVPWLDRHFIEHALDIGAHGVLVPKVETPTEAVQAVKACLYPPTGHRGINPVRASAYFSNLPTYLEQANDRTMCMLQVESAKAVHRAGELAAVPGVDVIFIGMGDLASTLGQPGDVTGQKMDEARHHVLKAVKQAGKIAGIFAYSIELARQYAEEGFEFIAIGNEIKALRESVLHSVEYMQRSNVT